MHTNDPGSPCHTRNTILPFCGPLVEIEQGSKKAEQGVGRATTRSTLRGVGGCSRMVPRQGCCSCQWVLRWGMVRPLGRSQWLRWTCSGVQEACAVRVCWEWQWLCRPLRRHPQHKGLNALGDGASSPLCMLSTCCGAQYMMHGTAGCAAHGLQTRFPPLFSARHAARLAAPLACCKQQPYTVTSRCINACIQGAWAPPNPLVTARAGARED